MNVLDKIAELDQSKITDSSLKNNINTALNFIDDKDDLNEGEVETYETLYEKVSEHIAANEEAEQQKQAKEEAKKKAQELIETMRFDHIDALSNNNLDKKDLPDEIKGKISEWESLYKNLKVVPDDGTIKKETITLSNGIARAIHQYVLDEQKAEVERNKEEVRLEAEREAEEKRQEEEDERKQAALTEIEGMEFPHMDMINFTEEEAEEVPEDIHQAIEVFNGQHASLKENPLDNDLRKSVIAASNDIVDKMNAFEQQKIDAEDEKQRQAEEETEKQRQEEEEATTADAKKKKEEEAKNKIEAEQKRKADARIRAEKRAKERDEVRKTKEAEDTTTEGNEGEGDEQEKESNNEEAILRALDENGQIHYRALSDIAGRTINSGRYRDGELVLDNIYLTDMYQCNDFMAHMKRVGIKKETAGAE